MRYPYAALWDETNTELACARYASQYTDLEFGSTCLTPGDWYYISVDNYSSTGYRGTFTLCVDEGVDYDFKDGAIELTDLDNWCSPEAAYTTLNATPDELKGSCWNTGPNYNRWFKFQATTTDIMVEVKTGGSEGTLQYPYVAIWDDANTELACGRYSTQYGDLRTGTTSLVPGNWYYISVDNLSGLGRRGTFTLCLNDDIDYDFKMGAIELTDLNNWCSAEAAYTTLNATPDEVKGSCWNTGPNYNRWFKFQATTTDVMVQVKTGGSEGSLQYPYVAIWDELNNEIACARYSSQYSDITTGTTSLVPGDWYYISVDNLTDLGRRGTFTLCVTDIIDYDFKLGAIELADLNNWCSPDAAYTTLNATPDEAKGSCWNTGPNYNRWFKFQATTADVMVQVKTGGSEGSLQYPYVAIWDELNNEIACARYSSQYSDITTGTTSLVPGDWYYISVDNLTDLGRRGTFTLCVTDIIDYDFKLGAIELADLNNWCSPDAAYTTLNATPDEAKGSCWNTGPNYNRWFKFQATTADVMVQVKTGGSEGSLQYPYVAIWDELNNEIACARYSSQYSDITTGTTSLVPGDWYYISVDNLTDLGRRGTFTLCVTDIIDYDFKLGAIELTDLNNWCSPDAAYTTLNATPDEAKGSCWNTGPNYNRWFKFQATTNEVMVQVKTGGSEGSLQYPYLAIWDDANNELACTRYNSQYGDITAGTTSLTPGNWYYISVDNLTDLGRRGTFTLCVTDIVDYDFKLGAIELTDLNSWCSPDAAYTTVNASPDEVKGSCWNTGPNYNRWFKFQATTTEAMIHVKTGGSEGTMQYPYVALWDDASNEIACGMYSSQYSDIAIGATTLTPGNWYYISVDNLTSLGRRGTFTLCLSDVVDYDFKAGAIEISSYADYCSSLGEFTTVSASPDELQASCWPNGPNFNRWFKFQATTTDVTVQVKTGDAEGNLRYAYVALWDDLNNELACSYSNSSYDDLDITATGLTIGQWYYVTVDNANNTGYRGNFTLCMDDEISYDFKDGAIELSDFNGWCSTPQEYTTISATPDESAGSCWPNGPNYNRWFTFVAASSQISVQVRTTDTEGDLRRPMVVLWDATLNEIVCKSYASDYADIEIAASGLTIGNRYYVSVDNSSNSGYRGTFTLCISDNAINDNKANAIDIIDMNSWCSTEAKYSNILATDDGGIGSCFTGAVNKNVWYKFRANNTKMNITVTTGGTYGEMSSQQIAMFNTNNVEVGCTGPLAGQGSLVLTVDTLTVGHEYWVSIDDDGISGTFTICADDELVYSYPSGAVELTNISNWCSLPHAYTNVGEPADTKSASCWPAGTYNNKWFKFQATTSEIKIEVRTGSDYGTMRSQQVGLFNISGNEVGCATAIGSTGNLILQMDTLTPGNWYWFAVDDNQSSGDFRLCMDDEVDYDFQPGAIDITDLNNWCSSDASYSNLYATPDQSSGSCWTDNQGTGLKNVWFKFTATTNFAKVRIRTGNIYGSMQRQQVSIWNANGVEVGCMRLLSGNQGTITLQTDTLTIGNDYWISVDDDRVSGSFTLCIDDQIDYDYQAGAEELVDLNDWCSNDAAYNNIYATPDQVPGSCWTDNQGTGLKNVWFKYTATTNFTKVRVRTGNIYGTMQRQQVSLWNSNGVEVGCARLLTGYQGTITLQTDTLTIGNDYWISVDDDRVSGSFTLCIDDQIDYDYQSGAVDLTDLNDWCSNDAAYNNLYATPDQVPGSCWTDNQGTGLKNVWFKFTATTNFTKVRVRTGNIYGTMQRQQVSLWNSNGVEVGCARLLTGYQGTITLQTDTLTIGNDYWISVDDDRVSGSFTLCIDDQIDYDYQAGAVDLTDLNDWCSNDAAYNNLYATPDQVPGSCWTDNQGTGLKNVWFKFTATTNFTKVRVRTGNIYGTMQRQQVSLWNSNGVEVGCARLLTGYQGTITWQTDTLTIGNDYWISVDDDRVSGSFTLCIDDQIDYDYQSGAVDLTDLNDWCSNDAAYNNLYATPDQVPGSCWTDNQGTGLKNVWFKFTATTNFAKVRVRTGNIYGTMQRQQVSIWNANGVEVGCARLLSGNQGTITWQTDTLTIGNDYWISVDDDRVSGSFTLCVNDQVDYDFLIGAIEIADLNDWCSNDAAYNNLYATPDQVPGSCWTDNQGTGLKNVWFKFQATGSFIKVRVRTGNIYGTMQRQQASIWNANGDEVGCLRLSNSNQGTITMYADTLTTGNWYWISVDDDRVSGSFTLCVDENPDYNFKDGALELTNISDWCSNDAAYSNYYATPDRSMGSCWGGTENKNVWFKFQALSNYLEIRLRTGSVYGSMRYAQFAVWDEFDNEIMCAGPTVDRGTLFGSIDTLTIGNWYWISVDDNNTSGSFSICVNGTPLVVDVTGTDVTCNGLDDGTASAAVQGGSGPGTYTYSWTGPNGFTSSNSTISNLEPGAYIVTVVDANLDMVIGAITIQEPSVLSINQDALTHISCFGLTDGSISVTTSGGSPPYNYSWTGPGSYTSSNEDISGLAAGAYSLVVTDANGCIANFGPITIIEPPTMIVTTIAVNSVSCNGLNNGSIEIEVNGGTPPYSYNWTGPSGYNSIMEDIVNLLPGVYNLVVTDLNSCVVNHGPISIIEPTAITIDSENATDIICNGSNNGTVAVTASGGTGALVYTLMPGALSNLTGSFTNLSANNYTVSVTDANGCGPVASSNLIIAEPAAISIDTEASTDITCNGANDGTVTVTASGGTGALIYTLNPGAISNGTGTFTNLSANSYTVSVTDANGCGPEVSATLS